MMNSVLDLNIVKHRLIQCIKSGLLRMHLTETRQPVGQTLNRKVMVAPTTTNRSLGWSCIMTELVHFLYNSFLDVQRINT